MATPDPGDRGVDAAVWDACVDDTLPPGVVVFQDAEGRPWRFPLVEYSEDSARSDS